MFTCEDFIKASKQCLWCTCACAKKNKHQIFGTADCRAALKFQMVSLKFGELWCSVYGTSVMQCAVCNVQCANKQKIEACSHSSSHPLRAYAGSLGQLDSPSTCTSGGADPRKKRGENMKLFLEQNPLDIV